MTFPPPSHDPNRPGNGGGFGPPPQEPPQQEPQQTQQTQEGFGPPIDPAPSGGPGQPGPPALRGGFGPPPLPPPPAGPPPVTGRARTAAIVTGVAVGLAVVAGVAFFGAQDDDGGGEKAAAAPSSPSNRPLSSPSGAASASAGGSEDPGQGAPLGGGDDRAVPSPDPSKSSGRRMPYVVLKPGTCFDHPAMDSSVTKVEKRSCDRAHDGEVITNQRLTGDFSSERAIQRKALSLCATDAEKRLESVPNDGREYYYYAFYPALGTYTEHRKDRVSCALTVSTGKDGAKLKEPIPK
ncbi:hypothetical protein [Streptomyces sp. NPDC021212]|uniref:hypothetical protein n=1 Tax=Streptomyces sp. NPDC021212 TaxID=3365118 RepID=UPI0037B54BB1